MANEVLTQDEVDAISEQVRTAMASAAPVTATSVLPVLAESAETGTVVLPITAAPADKHDEAQDVDMLRAAMAIMRELLAREAVDGNPDEIWELYLIVSILEQMGTVLFMEQWDIEMEQMSASADYRKALISVAKVKYAPVVMAKYGPADVTVATGTPEASTDEAIAEVTPGGDDMALTAENRAEIAEIVAASTSAAVSPLLASMGELVAALRASAPAAAAAADEAEAAKAPPFTKKDDEKNEDEKTEDPADDAPDKEKKDDKAKASATEPEVVPAPAPVTAAIVVPAPPAPPVVTGEVTSDVATASAEGDDEDDGPSDEEYATAMRTVRADQRGVGASSYRVMTQEGRKSYLDSVARQHGISERIPVGAVAALGNGNKQASERDLLDVMPHLFRRAH